MLPERLGTYCVATVPDTLDLAERAKLAINSMTGSLDPGHDYELYLKVVYTANPAFMYHEATGVDVMPKFVEALPMMRLMSGSTQNLDIERKMLRAMQAHVEKDGLYWVYVKGRPWAGLEWNPANEDFANIYANGRFILGMMNCYQYDGNPVWKGRIRKMIAGLRRIARFDEDMAYFPDSRVGDAYSYPRSGYASSVGPPSSDIGFGYHMYHSGVIRALAKWYAMSGDKEALDLTRKLVNFGRRPSMWRPTIPRESMKGLDPLIHPESMVGFPPGYFVGHFHGHVMYLRSLMDYAIVADDTDLMDFVRDGYDYARSLGISRMGWFIEGTTWDSGRTHCESCCVADMTALAIKLSDAGVGDYWEDVDRYARNQLTEQQLVSKELLKRCVDGSPKRDVTPPGETADRVIDRTVGCWAGYATPTECSSTFSMHCCTANAAQAIYCVWEGIVRNLGDGLFQINLLLNRTSPWLDIESYLPYEGRVVIKNKTAKRVHVRVPNWVSRKYVRLRVGSKAVANVWLNNYLLVNSLKPGDVVTIDFHMKDSTVQATWMDTTYTLKFRGNTVIDVSPRNDTSHWYPLYQRMYIARKKAPMVRKRLYLTDKRIDG
ncbi:MAG: hypothetical protein HYX78_08155 [Armatimonadetes bacterium]|nr:hypothetical protein [Armatimonadota bacterium]